MPTSTPRGTRPMRVVPSSSSTSCCPSTASRRAGSAPTSSPLSASSGSRLACASSGGRTRASCGRRGERSRSRVRSGRRCAARSRPASTSAYPSDVMPTNPVELSVVVPVYNNADTLDELIDRLIAVLDPMAIPFELIFVDDGSRDASLRVLERRADRDPRIRPSALVRNFGSQSAACAGFDLVRGRWVAMLDADLENCPEDIPALLAPLREGYDLVCGYRENRDAPWLTRRLPSRLMNAYVNRQTGTHLHDVGCGMRAC